MKPSLARREHFLHQEASDHLPIHAKMNSNICAYAVFPALTGEILKNSSRRICKGHRLLVVNCISSFIFRCVIGGAPQHGLFQKNVFGISYLQHERGSKTARKLFCPFQNSAFCRISRGPFKKCMPNILRPTKPFIAIKKGKEDRNLNISRRHARQQKVEPAGAHGT